MRILALEDTLAHQVRMEKTLAEIAEEMGLDIQVKITEKFRNLRTTSKMKMSIRFIFWI